MIPKRIVLDTNVCLDLFVFRDPRWTRLLAAMTDRQVQAVTRHDCRQEWLIVLDYSHLSLDQESRAKAIAEFDACINCIDTVAAASATPLPICKDADDQKFLELARDAKADALITKDKALLKLARKTARAGLFAIMSPETWLSSHPATPDAGSIQPAS